MLLTNFFFAFLWTETNSRSITTQKRTRPISSHLDRTSLISKRIFSCGTNAGNPEQAGWAHLARSGSQSERRIRFTFPACRFSHIILLVRILCLVSVLFRGWWTQYFSLFYPHPGDSLEAYHGRNFWHFSKKNCFFLRMSVKRKELLTVRHTKADILTVLRKYLHPIETLISRFNSPTFYMLYVC